MKLKVKKGRHRSNLIWPVRWLMWKPRRIEVEFWFDETIEYDLKDGDQWDWNKLFGVAFNPFNPNDETVMIGFRWNVEKQRVELNAYFHFGGLMKRDWTEPIMELKPGEKATGIIEVDHEKKDYKVAIKANGRKTGLAVRSFTHSRKLARWIHPWFGGNKKAPQRINFFFKKIRPTFWEYFGFKKK